MKLQLLLFLACGSIYFSSCAQSVSTPKEETGEKKYSVTMPESEWKIKLTADQYYILRESGTERAFSGAFWDHHEEGSYHCAGCKQPLFSSTHKFDSGTGWPSYWQPVTKNAVITATDNSHGMTRDEVVCSNCGGHLGHVFEDGPEPTGLRYCINSAALTFVKK